jgi:two-component system chemotaxis response regulator CheY
MYGAGTKVLVVDDMLTMRKIISKTLKEVGITDITEAPDGAAAFKATEDALASGKPFQLILSDWNMPQMSGLDFLKKCRADERFKAMPFVLITAESEKSQVIEAVQAGVSNYIVKPFTADQLKEKLTATYQKHNKA